jgi:hypothetical protein
MARRINTFGVMRGGIHVVHGWIMTKFTDRSVVYYNNIRDPVDLSDRLISQEDSRIGDLGRLLTSSERDASLVLKSYESRSLELCPSDSIGNESNIVIIRNPYNNLASSIAYREKGGQSPDVKSDLGFLDLWKSYAREFLGLTSHLPNKTTIVYDEFIVDPNYRRRIAEQLDLELASDELLTLRMGGGSSFQTVDYLNRHQNYRNHPVMLALLNDEEVAGYWREISKKSET